MKQARTDAVDSALFMYGWAWGAIDALDFRLLDALRKDPLASHASLARTLERSPSSIRRRWARLESAGVLIGFVTVPAPAVLGLEGTAATWTVTAPAESLLALPGTIMAGNHIDGGTLAGGFAPSAKAWLAAASDVVGEDPATQMPLGTYDGPTLGPLDLRVLRAMIDEPRGSAESLAARCGLSAKTVRSRRATMVQNKAVHIYPIIRTSRMDDLVYHLHVTCTQAEVPAVAALLREASIEPDDGPILCCFVRAASLAEQARTLADIRALGVENVEVIHEDEWEIDSARLARMVDARLAEWSTASART